MEGKDKIEIPDKSEVKNLPPLRNLGEKAWTNYVQWKTTYEREHGVILSHRDAVRIILENLEIK